MKIQIIGEGAAADALRGHLESLGYWLAGTSDKNADFVVRLESAAHQRIALTGMPGEFGDTTRRLIEELAPHLVDWREGGSPRELHIATGASHADAVVRGVLRALLQITRHGVKKSWYEKYF